MKINVIYDNGDARTYEVDSQEPIQLANQVNNCRGWFTIVEPNGVISINMAKVRTYIIEAD